MSPPKVSLAGKEPLKTASDEPLPEKSDGVEFPAIINVETDRRAHNHRLLLKQRRFRRVICGAVMVIIVAVAALGTMFLVLHLRRHHRKNWTCQYGGDNKLTENVKVNHVNKTIQVDHNLDSDPNTSSMMFLHEYNRGLVAYKDVDKIICYIDRLNETFEDGYERWESYERDDRDPKALEVLSQRPIEIEVIKHLADIHIYAHCQDAQSFWVMEIEETKITTEMKIVYV